jgi:hypothetical protein
MELIDAVQKTVDVIPKLFYAFSRSVPSVEVKGSMIQLTDLSLGILFIINQLVKDRTLQRRGSGVEQRESCFQADIEAITIHWWDDRQAATKKLSKQLTALKRRGLLEPTLVKSDLRLHAWHLTENGKEYLKAITATQRELVHKVFQQMSPAEVEQAVAALQNVSNLTWAGMRAAVGMPATREADLAKGKHAG